MSSIAGFVRSLCWWRRPLASTVLVFAAAWCLSAACATTNPLEVPWLTRPYLARVRLGQTTRAEMVDKLGKPSGEKSTSLNGRKVLVMWYSLSGNRPVGSGPRVHLSRELTVVCHSELVVGYYYSSNMESDSTNYEDYRVGEIEIGKTTEAEAVSLLGTPSGRSIYPAVADEKETAILYSYAIWRKNLFAGHKDREIVIGPDGRVKRIQGRSPF